MMSRYMCRGGYTNGQKRIGNDPPKTFQIVG